MARVRLTHGVVISVDHKHSRIEPDLPAAGSSKKRDGRTAIAALIGAGVALAVFVLYLMTLAPTILTYDRPDMLDSAMMQMQVAVLGITHPTGYPTYLMLSHLFTYLPVGDVAYRVNLASAAYAALAVFVVYWAGLLLSRRVVAAAVGALAFGLGSTLWSQAVITEVYTLNALTLSLAVIALLLWRVRHTDRYLLLSAFLCGLALTNHMTSGLLLPASLLFVAAVEWRKLLEWKLVLQALGLFLVGLSPYLYLPLRAAMDPPMSANNPTTFERFWYVVSGGNLRESFFAFGPAELPGRVAFYLGHLLNDFNWVVVMVAMVGAVFLVFRDRPVALLLGFLYFGWLFHAIENDIPDIQLYFIPTYLVLCLWASVGFGALFEAVEEVLLARLPVAARTAAVVVVSVLALLLPLTVVGKAYAQNDRSDDYRGREVVEVVAENAARGATVLHHRSELWYLLLVEERRQDLTIVDPFAHNVMISWADLVWPDEMDLATTNLRWGTHDLTGVASAREAASRGPVYVMAQDDVNPFSFQDAGFRVIQVEGPLYELVPPGREPYTSD